MGKVMKNYQDNTAKRDAIRFIGMFIVAGTLMCLMTGCSFKVETGWHGQTGRDDRVQTQLVRGGYADGDDVQTRRAGVRN